jgi:chromosome segregation protein
MSTNKGLVNIQEKPQNGRAYITKLVVEGFKSYGPKRKEIPLGKGFIAIVGPNGAGKSNIGDAISFALGLASSKVLRAKNLSYLIWSKGNKKAPYAEVEVHFKNEGAFPLEAEEIIFSRRVYPNGRTVFKINGKTVKEKEVKDLLTRAGITENAYNIVLQGDIVHFLKMTPVGRRKLIEEIAGIGEFDLQKNQALNDLQQIEAKLKELEIILHELESQLGTLQKDKEKLNLYKEIQTQLKKVETKLLLKELFKIFRQKETLTFQLKELEEKIQTLKEKKEQINFLVAQKENELREIEQILLPYREKIGKLTSSEEFIKKTIQELQRQKTEILSRKEEIKRLKASLQKEIECLKKILEAKQQKISLLEEEEIKPLKEQRQNLLKEIEKIENQLKEALEKLSQTENLLRELSKEKQKKEQILQNLKEEINRLNLKLEQTLNQIQHLEKEKKLLEEELKNEPEYENLEKKLSAVKKEYEQLSEKYKQLETKLKKVKEEKEEVLKRIFKLETENSFSDNQIVEELKKNIEGVYGTVASLIRVKEEEHILPIEVGGGNRLRYVVVENEDVAKKCIDYLKTHRLGRLTFLPLNRIKPNRLDFLPRINGVIDYLFNLVDYDPKYEKAVLFTFGDTILVKDFQTAKKLGIGIYRMVTLEGELFEKGGTISGGHIKTTSLLRESFIKGQLEELREQLNELNKKEEKLKKLLEHTKEKLFYSQGLYYQLQRELKEFQNLKSKKEKKLLSLENQIKQGKEYIDYLQNLLEEKRKQLKDVSAQVENLSRKLEEINLLREKLFKSITQSGLQNLKDQLKEVENLLEEKQTIFHSLEKEILKIQSQIKEKEQALLNLEREEIELQQRTKNIESKISQLENELKTLQKEKQKLGKTISELTEKQALLRKEIQDLKEELYSLEKQLDELNREREHLLVQLSKLQQQYEEIEEKLPKEIIKEEPKEDELFLKKLKRELENKIQNLGQLNFRAMEQYNETENRYKDTKEKYQTLLREKKAILDFIKEIESKKRKIFLSAFNAVNRHLKEIFSFLSPGGKAYMEIEKPEKLFESGINLVVKPRGKDVKYLEAMSGGEKTLAALSLIFALQRYKPAPFYYFDEVDAHLDEANALKVGELIKNYSSDAQFIVVTLRESVAYLADRLIGVTAKNGISQTYIVEAKNFENTNL